MTESSLLPHHAVLAAVWQRPGSPWVRTTDEVAIIINRSIDHADTMLNKLVREGLMHRRPLTRSRDQRDLIVWTPTFAGWGVLGVPVPAPKPKEMAKPVEPFSIQNALRISLAHRLPVWPQNQRRRR